MAVYPLVHWTVVFQASKRVNMGLWTFPAMTIEPAKVAVPLGKLAP